MTATAFSPTLAGRFEWLIEGLCKVFGAQAHKRGVEAALAWAVWNRVRVLGERFSALVARRRAGRMRARSKSTPHPGFGPLRGPNPQGESTPHPSPLPQGEREKAAGPRLPREFGWIRSVVPETAQFAGVLTWLLRDPELAALVEKTPETGRILRPLCHLLGVKAPEFLRRGYVPADPAPHQGSPPPEAERDDCGVADLAEASVAAEPALPVEAPVAAEMPAPASPPPTAPPVPYHQRPGGLYWDGKRWAWS